ncbi:MAG: 5'-nucleotidase C-terminal domain-containing protein, partial [Acidobacteriota bacterium]|nr:5'-nucleotidase C-terminal domain-containing protein [Acidobacteriota bacterium]
VMPLAAQVKTLTILHSNDLHAHLLPDDRDNGGFARLATEVRRQKSQCAACLYLNAGDLVQGTPVSTLFHGAPIYQIANLLGIDVSALGNHEFDYGWRRVQEFFHIARFPIVSANLVDADGKTMTWPYVIQTAGGIRVGIIGAILGDLVGTVITKESAGPWHTLPVVETVRKYARELHDRTDLIVVLGHIHDDTEVNEILKQVPEVSVVVAGHSHEGYQAMIKLDGRVAVLVRANGVQLGRLDLKLDVAAKKVLSAEWTKLPIDSKIPPAPDVAREVAKWESKVSKLVDVSIGESTTRLERNNPELRKMIERAMAEQSGADIAWINPGNVRDTMPQGRILARTVWNILPFDNYIVLGKFKGSELPPSITTRYPVEPGREYTVATSDFTAANQSDKDQLNATGLRFPQTGPLQRDAVIEWIKKKKVVP